MQIRFPSLLRQNHVFFLSYLFLLAACLVTVGIFTETDLFLGINAAASPALDGFFLAWTWLGNGLTMMLAAVALLFVKFRYAVLTLLAYGYTSVFAQVLKRVFNAPRPVQYYLGQEQIRIPPGLDAHHWYSFPSGHAVTAFALAAVLAYLLPPSYRKYSWVLVAAAAVTAFSRVYLAQHFVLDIVAGSVLGVFLTYHLIYLLLNCRWYHSAGLEGRAFGRISSRTIRFSRSGLLPPLILLAVSLIVLFWNLGKPDIYILDEAKNAECAREMLVSGNYVVPEFNGRLRTDKPPLHYFFMTAAYKAFGVSAFSARFFSPVFGVLTIMAVYAFARRFLGGRAALFGGLALLSSLHFNLQMRLAVPDPYLIFWMTGSLMTFFLFLQDRRMIWLVLMYLSAGLGILTKGPVALALPGLAMLTFLVWTKRFSWPCLRAFRIPLGVLIVSAVTVPWYWLNYRATKGEWLRGFLLEHNIGRYADTMEGHGGFFLLPLLMVLIGLFPLGAFGIPAAVSAFRGRRNEVLLFSLIVVVVIMIFFSFSRTMLPNYTVPAYPFMALILGDYLDRLPGLPRNSRAVRYSYLFYTVIACLIPAGVYFGLRADGFMSRYSGLWVLFSALPLGALAGWFLIARNNRDALVWVTACSFILTNVLFLVKAYPAVYENNPVSSSVRILRDRPHLVAYRILNPAFIFNLRRTIPYADSVSELKEFLSKHPGAAVISRKSYQEEIGSATGLKPVFEQRDTFESPTTIIME